MRALMKQTVSRLAADYTVLQDGEGIFKIHVPFALHTVKVEVSNASGHLCTMERAIVGDAPLTQRNMFHIFSAPDCEAGYIARRRRYHQLVKADTFDISFHGYDYTAYEIALWKDGIYFPVYENEKQVAMVHKGTKVRDNLDVYELYALDSRSMYTTVLFAAYIDVLKFRHAGEFCKNKVEVKFSFSLSRKARAMLNKSFMDKC